MYRPNLYMLIGVPATGKSTWWERHKDESVAYISMDAIIERVAAEQGKTYNEVFKSAAKGAEKEMLAQVKAAVEAGQDIVWDQTNLNKATRAKKLAMIPERYRKIAVYFEIPEDHEKRLASRPGKTIPPNVLASMKSNLELPELAEGFTVVTSANNKYIDAEGTAV